MEAIDMMVAFHRNGMTSSVKAVPHTSVWVGTVEDTEGHGDTPQRALLNALLNLTNNNVHRLRSVTAELEALKKQEGEEE